MLGNIVGINDNQVLLKLTIDVSKLQNLISTHVIMEDQEKQCIGEITDIKDGIAYINLLGEIKDEKFVFGVINKPSFGALVKIVSKEKVPIIIGVDNYRDNLHLNLGMSALYNGVTIGMSINDFFSNHFAIFGSTGSGKSCSVARIFQNLFEKKQAIPYRASIFIFDAYGEYHRAFSELNTKNPQINFKSYTTNLSFPDQEILKMPPWLLTIDDYALLLGADKASQLPIIEKALKLVSVFGRDEELVLKHKNDIISRALLDILSSGRPAPQIRDQLVSVLAYYNTRELNLETPIYQPGYTRPLKQCFFIDNTGKIRDMETISAFFESFLTDNLELTMPDGSFRYTLKDLKDAFDFALISEGVLKSDKVYDESNVLKVRLHGLVNGDYAKYFDLPEYMTREQYIKSLLTANNGRKAQIINFNINYVDDRFAKSLTKIFSKLLFDYAKGMSKRTTLPFHIVLEEAHRYVQNDNDIALLGYNIFERITKEGRKYGVMLGLISQRPSELSETTLSQCSNFLIFKMLHPRDIDYIKDIVPNITLEIVKRLRILQPGTCIAFGNAFKVPVIVKFDMPNPAPTSESCDVSKIWFVSNS
jgi:DNA helicase HerA-like ATPase